MSVPNHFGVVQGFVAAFGIPDKDDDEGRRAWTLKVAQTFAAKFPAEGWGTKKSGPTAPQSTDVVCTQTPFEGIDLLNGTTGELQWSETGPLTGQVFIAVLPYDWLDGGTPPEPPEPPEEPSALFQILGRLDVIGGNLGVIAEEMHVLNAKFDALTAMLKTKELTARIRL